MRAAELTPMRRVIGRRMAASKREAPHFYLTSEIVLDPATSLVDRLKRQTGQRVTFTAVLVRACVVTLKEHPMLNAVWSGDELLIAEEANVGIAIALDEGLLAPAIFERDARDIASTARALESLVSRARGGKLRRAEITDATFTVSNLGMFEVSSFMPIIAPPQIAILGIGKPARVPRYEREEIVPHSVVTATVSADHRAVDGADVARFLATFKSILESPDGIDG